MLRRPLRVFMAAALVVSTLGIVAPAMASSGSPGDPEIVITINDSHAGGSYDQVFELAYDGATPTGTPVYIYVPEGAIGDPTVDSVNPQFDHNPTDEFDPCADNTTDENLMTQAQIDALGDELANQIVAVDEAHFGEIGLADASDPNSDALVLLAYNVQDESYYDCSVTTYTAGYFAPEYIRDAGMNVIVIDSFDWANRVGEAGDSCTRASSPTSSNISSRTTPIRASCHGWMRASRTSRPSLTAIRPVARTSPSTRSSIARRR